MQGAVGSGESPPSVQSLAAVLALLKLPRRWHLYSACLCPPHLPLRLLPKLHGLSWGFYFNFICLYWGAASHFVAEDVPPAFSSQALASQRCLYPEWWASSAEPPACWAGTQPVSCIFSPTSYFCLMCFFTIITTLFKIACQTKCPYYPQNAPHPTPSTASAHLLRCCSYGWKHGWYSYCL